MKWHSYEDSESWARALADTISTDLEQALRTRGGAQLAVSGGRSPIPFFEALSKADIDWPGVAISLVDERVVDPDDPDSNERLVRSHLLVNHAAQARFKGLASGSGTLRDCLERANQDTSDITVAVLGMGDDGHTASLFPGAPQLESALTADPALRYAHITPPAAPYERISMTLPALREAGRLVLAISGRRKREVFEQARRKVTPALPISYFIDQTGVPLDVYWHA